MSDELKAAIDLVIEYVDNKMMDSPSRELADLSNSLEALKDNV